MMPVWLDGAVSASALDALWGRLRWCRSGWRWHVVVVSWGKVVVGDASAGAGPGREGQQADDAHAPHQGGGRQRTGP